LILWRVFSVKIQTFIHSFDEVGQKLYEVGQLVYEVGQLVYEVGQLVYEVGQLLDGVGQLVYEVGQLVMRSVSYLMGATNAGARRPGYEANDKLRLIPRPSTSSA